jgi:hypothetical protein
MEGKSAQTMRVERSHREPDGGGVPNDTGSRLRSIPEPIPFFGGWRVAVRRAQRALLNDEVLSVSYSCNPVNALVVIRRTPVGL